MSHMADFRQVFHQLEYLSDEIAKQHGVEHLAGPQGHVLVFLGKNQDKEIFVKDIEAKLKISKSVASNLVKRMEKNGFIKTVPSRKDKRYKQVVMTELGKAKLEPLGNWHEDLFRHLFVGIAHEEFEAMSRLIQQLKENIRKYKEDYHAETSIEAL